MDFIDASYMIGDYGLRLLAAATAGALIGLDREIQNRNAGLRTHMLTAIAAASFTILTIEMQKELVAQKYEGGDPIRIIEAITVGVSFLAAGTIIQRGGHVHGITTGAGMWLAGAIGLACGLGLYMLGTLITVMALVTLTVVGFIQSRLTPDREDSEPAAEGRSSKE